MRVQAFTSFSYSYLPRAMLLARTLRAAHPDWEITACIVDRPPPGLDPALAATAFDHVLHAEELGLDCFPAWIFRHDVVEACTAVKGAMLARLLEGGADRVVYLDPDIAIFHPLDEVVAKLDRASILLTPHQTEPNAAEAVVRDNEMTSLRYGIYNLGFIAVRGDATGRAFAQWWARRLHVACFDEVERGLFTDQKWCDLVPGLFPGVEIERDPGCNVASWNLSTRRLSFTRQGGILVNGSPLKFYHFTKIGGAGDVMTERYAGEGLEAIEVWNWYRRALRDLRVEGIPRGYWHYGSFDNGARIPKPVRVLFRESAELSGTFDDPFATGEGSFHAWLLRERPELLAAPGGGFEPV